MDFNVNIYKNRQELGRPFLVAHRGVYGANIPCNTLAAYGIAVEQGADVVEVDVSKSKDGKLFAFHPGMESQFLKIDKSLSELTYDEIKKLRLYNYDGVLTHYEIPELKDVLCFLKDKVYINIDKYWDDVKGITEEIRRCGVEKQVIVKSYEDEKIYAEVKEYAPDLMYMVMVKNKDTITDKLCAYGLNLIGEEVLFSDLSADVISDEYINCMHEKQKMIWVNPIIYNEEAVIAASFTDDLSLTNGADNGWGKLIDKKVDFVQTDWLIALRAYILRRFGK